MNDTRPEALAVIAADKLDQLAADLDAAKIAADKFPRCRLTEPLFVSYERMITARRVDAENALSHLSLAIGSGQDSITAYSEAGLLQTPPWPNGRGGHTDPSSPTALRQWAREWRAFAGVPETPLTRAKAAMSALTDEQRLEVMSAFCRGCGHEQLATGPQCQCWNDE